MNKEPTNRISVSIVRWLSISVAAASFSLAGISTAVAEDPIKICVIDDASGDFAGAVIPKTQGARLAVAEINARGDLLGRGIELIHYDGQSEVRRHQDFAERCILRDEADVVMAGYTSSQRDAARAIANRHGTIFFHNNQGEGGIVDNHSFFTGPIPEQQILPGIEYMINKYGPRMYVLAADYGFGQVSADWTRTAATRFDGEIVGEEFISLGNSEFASTISRIQRADPDFLVQFLVGGAQSQFFPQAESAGLNLPGVSTVNLQQGYEHKSFSPPALENLYVPVAFIEEVKQVSKNAREFDQSFREMFPDAPYVNQPARSAYIAVNFMAQAWEIAGTTETKAVIDALESGLEFDGPEGVVRLDPETHHTAMPIRLAKVQSDHSIEFVEDFGVIEPWWLRSMDVDLTEQKESRQYLPEDDPALTE